MRTQVYVIQKKDKHVWKMYTPDQANICTCIPQSWQSRFKCLSYDKHGYPTTKVNTQNRQTREWKWLSWWIRTNNSKPGSSYAHSGGILVWMKDNIIGFIVKLSLDWQFSFWTTKSDFVFVFQNKHTLSFIFFLQKITYILFEAENSTLKGADEIVH